MKTNQRDNLYDKDIILLNTFRKLWEQHIMWTRSFIISTISDLGDLPYVTNRLLENPTDFANVLKLFYGNKKANTFKELLTQHLMIAGELVNAAKAGDTNLVNQLNEKWYANAEEISIFLASINPHWSRERWQELFFSHLEMTENEVVSRISGNYEENVRIYDDIEEGALAMADYMYSGIVKQFRFL